MKILIYSSLFYPKIGGVETVVEILASTFTDFGHKVTLVCPTPVDSLNIKKFDFNVIHRPHFNQFIKLIQCCDVYFQASNLDLNGIWPMLFFRRRWLVLHHNFYSTLNKNLLKNFLRRICAKFATHISASQYIAQHLFAPSFIIHNPYDNDVFYETPNVPRDKELVFLGRLEAEKGVDVLIKALSVLKVQGLKPRLTIIGFGSQEQNLRNQMRDLNLEIQIDFVGIKTGLELARLLNAHKILIVPSRYDEPFGVVALEGIACGCIVVASEGGGLKEAIGPCGVTFPNENEEALAECLIKFLSKPETMRRYRNNANQHLTRFKKRVVAETYLKLMSKK